MAIQEIIDAAKSVKPYAEKDGRKIVSFEDSVALANMEGVEPTPTTGQRTYNADGSLARTNKQTAAINPHNYFANRFRATQKKMRVVVDWRAIQEQSTGEIYIRNIPAYVFERVKTEDTPSGEKGELTLTGIEMVSDTEFISSFTDTLSVEAMMQIAPLIANFGSDITASEMPI